MNINITSIQYNLLSPSQILIDGGYITFSNNNPICHYYLQDHLGNNRVVFRPGDYVEQVNHYYPFGGLMGESTGGNVQKYKYNGKELDRMNGLDWYDYGARHYDAAIASWPTMDPLCEKYYSLSPYNYCGNNPIRFIDPDGIEPTPSEAARIAAHVYGDKKDDILTGGWRVSQRNFGINLTDVTGLKSLVYERVVDGRVTEYVYATAGTVSRKDWEENVKQPFGLSEQYRNSANNAKILSNVLRGFELNYVGHSKGGGEAALNSLVTSDKKLKGRKAFTFNAAGVGDITKFIEGDWETLLKSEGKINAYILLTDPLNKAQNNSPAMPDVNGKRHYLFPVDLPSVINGHSIDNIIKNFGVNPRKYTK